MKVILRYRHGDISTKKVLDVVRVRGKKGQVAVKVNRRKLRAPEGKGKEHFVEDGIMRWDGFMRMFSVTLEKIVKAEVIRDEKWKPT